MFGMSWIRISSIMARTDARGAVGGSLDEVIRRGKAYLETGVDINLL